VRASTISSGRLIGLRSQVFRCSSYLRFYRLWISVLLILLRKCGNLIYFFSMTRSKQTGGQNLMPCWLSATRFLQEESAWDKKIVLCFCSFCNGVKWSDRNFVGFSKLDYCFLFIFILKVELDFWKAMMWISYATHRIKSCRQNTPLIYWCLVIWTDQILFLLS
jgi:hypothetical protein